MTQNPEWPEWPEVWVGKDTTAGPDGGWQLVSAEAVERRRRTSPHVAIERYLPASHSDVLVEALEEIAEGNPDCCREADVPPSGWCVKCIARDALDQYRAGGES